MKAANKHSYSSIPAQPPSEPILSKADQAIKACVDSGLFRVDSVRGAVYGLSGRVLKGSLNHDGYVRVTVSRPVYVKVFLHRIVAYAIWSDELFKWEVNHVNEIKTDNRACNLELVTREQNMQHSMNGAKNHKAVLTAEQVKEIKRRYKFRGGVNSGKALAQEFGVCKQTICNIVHGKVWKHI